MTVFNRAFVFLLGVSFFSITHASVVPPYEVIHTKNGVDVYYFKSPNIPLFEVRFVFEGGSTLDPKGKSGLTMFSTAMHRRGIPGMDEDEISRRMDDLAAGIDASVGDERVVFGAYGLNEQAKSVLDLFFKQLSSPTFPKKAFDRILTNHLQDIDQLKDSPESLAAHVLSLLVFNGTSWVRPNGGLRADVKRLKLEEVKRLFPKILRTDHLKALVIGGKSREEIADLVVRGIEQLPCPACETKVPAETVVSNPNWAAKNDEIVLVERSGLSEAHVAMGFSGPKRNTPEYYDLRVAETILSGPFGSRMNLVLRETLNLTYNASAGFTFGEKNGAFTFMSSTRNEKSGELIREAKKLLSAFATGQVDEQELQAAKDFLVGSFPIGLQNLYTIANTFFNGLFTGVDMGFLDQFQSGIAAVTSESLKTAVLKHVNLKNMRIVVVGDTKKIGTELKKERMNYVIKVPDPYL